MKIMLILCCIICLVITTVPHLTGNELGNAIVGEDSLLFKTVGVLSKISNFFSQIVLKAVDSMESIPNLWDKVKNWFSGIFN